MEQRAAAYDRLKVESVANCDKADWPLPAWTLKTDGFGFHIGEFPPVHAPLTLAALPGLGHGLHTQAPKIGMLAILE